MDTVAISKDIGSTLGDFKASKIRLAAPALFVGHLMNSDEVVLEMVLVAIRSRDSCVELVASDRSLRQSQF